MHRRVDEQVVSQSSAGRVKDIGSFEKHLWKWWRSYLTGKGLGLTNTVNRIDDIAGGAV